MPITDITSYNNATTPDAITKITKENVLQDSHTERSLKFQFKKQGLRSASISISVELLICLTSGLDRLGAGKTWISETKHWKEYRREGGMNMVLIYVKIRDF